MSKWTPELVAQRLSNLDQPREVSSEVQELRDAAATLAWFDPQTLRPFRAEGVANRSGGLPPSFLADCEPIRAVSGSALSLRAPIRRQTLAALVQRGAVASAIAANEHRPQAPLQLLLEGFLQGRGPSLDQVPDKELSPAIQVAEWLKDIVPVPSTDDLRRRLEGLDILAPLRALVGEHFRGRDVQLEKLRQYTGALRPQSRYGALKYDVANWTVQFDKRDVLSFAERPPLVIHGIGGMGKSTLVARFILEHVDLPEESRFPFAYLDFDEPTLSLDQPLSMFAEILRQLGSQYARGRAMASAARERALQSARGGSGLGAGASFDPSFLNVHVVDLRGVLEESGVGDKPFLLVLDTFEEVQFTSRAYLTAIFELLEQLQRAIPRLRTVIVGRSPVGPLKLASGNTVVPEEIPLGDLDPEAAKGYLEANGIVDETLLRTIVSVVGGNPLSLKLAADLVQREGGFVLPPLLVRILGEERIRGELYQRILSHIHDPDVRKLANPGLVLRLLTPGIISEVLAVPCGLQVTSPERATELYEGLAAEATLVERGADGLRHRSDVRRVMLMLLRDDQPRIVETIHQRAVAYHSARHDHVDRVEEVYHRLCLDDVDGARERWTPDLAHDLRGAMDDLPIRAQRLLSTLTGIPLSDRARQNADLEVWATDAERSVRDRLRLGRRDDLEAAKATLAERPEWPDHSRLPALEAHVLERLGDLTQARGFAEAALYTADRRRNSDEVVEMQMLVARIDERQGRFAQAKEGLDRAATTLARSGNADEYARATVARARLLHRLGAPGEALYKLESESYDVLKEDTALRPELRGTLAVAMDHHRPWLTGAEALALADALALAFAWPGTLDSLLKDLGATSDDVHFGGALGEVVFDGIVWAELRGVVRELSSRAGASPASAQVATGARLGPEDTTALHEELLAAAPTRGDLASMVRLELDVNLDAISTGGDQATVAYQVIQWLDANGRTGALIAALRKRNPGNPRLLHLAESAGLVVGPRP